MSNSLEYWREREERQRQFNIAEEAEYSKRIQEIYYKMYQNIQNDINDFYVKYAKAENITLAEAKKRIKKTDINEYAAKAKRYVEQAAKDRAANNGKTDRTAAYFSDEANAEMRLYNATMKINRLELLKSHIGLEMVDGHDELQKLFGEALSKRAMDEYRRQAGILGETVLNNEKFADSIVNASFHNAKFSDRIWMSQDLLRYRLNDILTQALIQGLNPRSITGRVTHLIKKEVTENKRAAAERLLRTELCRVQIDAQMKSYARNGYEKYIFLAEPTACTHCKALDEKVFPVEKVSIGENAPPIHPYCRCSTAAYAESDAEYEKWFYETTGKHSAQYELSQRMATKKKQKHSGAMYGAYNDNNDPDYTKRRKAGNDLFEQVKNRKKEFEIKAVANNSGFTIEEIERVYKHLFERKHLFGNGRIGLFDPDYYMMNSWLRLREGKNIFEHDLIMLHHELEEEKIMGDSLEIIYEKAHNEVQEKWDYQKALIEYLKNHDV